MLYEMEYECFQLRFNFTESHWHILTMLLCTSPWDKCLFLGMSSKTFAGQKQRQRVSCLGSRKEVKFMMGDWGKRTCLL